MSIRELYGGETLLAHRAMRALRPAYEDEDRFVAYVDHTLRPEGFRLVGVFADEQSPDLTADDDEQSPDLTAAVAVAGFRTGHNLAWGHYLYVDDLSTAPSFRRQGHAGALIEWLIQEARRLNCDQMHLDSGTRPERFDAHRLYHAHGLSIHAHHFARSVSR
jgi:GNAT superfamily N-acetyltransferase